MVYLDKKDQQVKRDFQAFPDPLVYKETQAPKVCLV